MGKALGGFVVVVMWWCVFVYAYTLEKEEIGIDRLIHGLKKKGEMDGWLLEVQPQRTEMSRFPST